MKKLPLILILLFIACGHDGISIVKTQGPTARKTYAGLSEKQYERCEIERGIYLIRL